MSLPILVILWFLSVIQDGETVMSHQASARCLNFM